MEEEKVESDVPVSDVPPSPSPSPLPSEQTGGTTTTTAGFSDDSLVQAFGHQTDVQSVWFSLFFGLALGYIAVRGLLDAWRS